MRHKAWACTFAQGRPPLALAPSSSSSSAPHALAVPISLPCQGALWEKASLRPPLSPLGHLLTLRWWCRTTTSPQLSVVQPSSPSISFPRPLWQALLVTQNSSQGLLAEALHYTPCILDHLGETGRDFPPWEALLWSGFLCPSLQVVFPARSQGAVAAKGWPWEPPSLQGQYSVTLSTSRLCREIMNGSSLCSYKQEATNKPMMFNGQENNLNKIAIGFRKAQPAPVHLFVESSTRNWYNHKMNRSLAKILCERDPLHLTCSVTLNFNYSSPLVLPREENANDVRGRQQQWQSPALHLHKRQGPQPDGKEQLIQV